MHSTDGSNLIDLGKACDAVCLPSRNEPNRVILPESPEPRQVKLHRRARSKQSPRWSPSSLPCWPSPDAKRSGM